MVDFININNEEAYSSFISYYSLAKKNNEAYPNAMLVASLNKENNQVDARYVNLQGINETKFIFYSNYNSPKARQFKSHNQVTLVFFWKTINIQVRIKAQISKLSRQESDIFFSKRDKHKNILSISSNQSEEVSSYEQVLDNYYLALKTKNHKRRPLHWGGYECEPYSFEFWEGHSSRINKRIVYEIEKNKSWIKKFLQP
jgi:pyridoxamine 5'-phosphate oxidase